MRFLGADPSTPADAEEAILMVKLNNRIVSEEKRIQKAAEKASSDG